MIRILVVDDDRELCALLRAYGERAGYGVDVAYTGAEGLNRAASGDYQLIVLDVMLPVLDGFQVLSEIRKSQSVPVLMLTAKGMEEDKVRGLSMGADDYLTKPFSMNELMARVASQIRRYTLLNPAATGAEQVIKLQGLEIDVANRVVSVNGKLVELTAKEFDLLVVLATNRGRIFTKKQLYSQVWAEEYLFDDSNIMSFISKLRKKIEPNPGAPQYIQTIRGVGYRFNGEAE